MNRKIVTLSIAHFPAKSGAGFNGIHEHEVSEVWTKNLRNQLELLGISVAIAPIGGLRNKVNYVNEHDSDVAIEIHFNGAASRNVSGVETLYCPNSVKGKAFATTVHALYAPEMHCKDRGIKEGWYKMDRPDFEDYPGDKEGDEIADYFLRKTACPALILEPEFISQLNNIWKYEDSACVAIAEGVKQYLEAT